MQLLPWLRLVSYVCGWISSRFRTLKRREGEPRHHVHPRAEPFHRDMGRRRARIQVRSPIAYNFRIPRSDTALVSTDQNAGRAPLRTSRTSLASGATCSRSPAARTHASASASPSQSTCPCPPHVCCRLTFATVQAEGPHIHARARAHVRVRGGPGGRHQRRHVHAAASAAQRGQEGCAAAFLHTSVRPRLGQLCFMYPIIRYHLHI